MYLEKNNWPFKCPKCNGDLWPCGYSIAWSLGGADKFQCTKCKRFWWYVICNTHDVNSSFYISANKDPMEECKKRDLLFINKINKNEKRIKTLLDFF